MKPGCWLENVNCAIEGIIWTARSQRHMRLHLVVGLGVLVAALLLHIDSFRLALLAVAVVLVLFAELINTAIEVIVDMVEPQYHPLAKRAKDVAAGAVLVASAGAVLLGYLALAPVLFLPLGTAPVSAVPGFLPVVALFVVTLLVVLLKAKFGRGVAMHGGMPSGHAAAAFSIVTSIALSGVDPVLAIMAMVVAVMASHSRLLMRVHTVWEVAAGAALGAGVTFALFWMFGQGS